MSAKLVEDATGSPAFPSLPAVGHFGTAIYPRPPPAVPVPATALSVPGHPALLEELDPHASGSGELSGCARCCGTNPELVAGPAGEK